MEKEHGWYIAVVTPNTEKSCEKKLKALWEKESGTHFNCYVPIQREMHEWPSTGKRVWIDKVLCPCYLFIQCTEQVRYKIACNAKFILHFLKDRARVDESGRTEFAVIPHDQMQNFRRMVGNAETPVTLVPSRLHIGSKVRVKSGRLAGMEGYLYRVPDGSDKLAIMLDILGCAKVDYPISLLELIDD